MMGRTELTRETALEIWKWPKSSVSAQVPSRLH